MIKLSSLDRIKMLAFKKFIKIEGCWDSLDTAWDVMGTYKTINKLPMYAQYYIFDILCDWDNPESSHEGEMYSIIEVGGELYITEYTEESDETPIEVVKTVPGLLKGDVVKLHRTTGTILNVTETKHGFYLVEMEITRAECRNKSRFISRESEKYSKEYVVIGNDEKYAVKVKENQCPECGGTGILTHYMHHDNGICYKCMGTGKDIKA